jgi:hypothetical protein
VEMWPFWPTSTETSPNLNSKIIPAMEIEMSRFHAGVLDKAVA